MPRTARAAVGGMIYHVLNRGNRRAEVFHQDGDYAAFVRLIRQACGRVPMRVLGFCLMPNHFHLVLWPPGNDDLSRWMGWLLTTHVRRYQKYYRSTGRLGLRSVHVRQPPVAARTGPGSSHATRGARSAGPSPIPYFTCPWQVKPAQYKGGAA